MAVSTIPSPLAHFKSTLEPRMLGLAQAEPRIASTSAASIEQLIPELGTFRKLSGIAQLFYYAFNKRAIRTAIEYEALSTLYGQATLLNASPDILFSDYDDALHELFIQSEPANVDQLLTTLTHGQYIPRKNALEERLASPSPNIDKSLLIKDFFIQLKNDIKKYRENSIPSQENKFGLLLQYFIDAIFETNPPQPRSITLKSPETIHKAPDHLLKLPESGNKKDFEGIAMADDSPAHEETLWLTPPPISPNIYPIHHAINFSFFTLNIKFNIMSDLSTTLTQDNEALHAALREHKQSHNTLKNQIRIAKQAADLFFFNWYTKLSEGFQALIQSAHDANDAQLKQTNAPKTGPLDAMGAALTDALRAVVAPSTTSSWLPSMPGFSRSAPNLKDDVFTLRQSGVSPPQPEKTSAEKKGWFW